MAYILLVHSFQNQVKEREGVITMGLTVLSYLGENLFNGRKQCCSQSMQSVYTYFIFGHIHTLKLHHSLRIVFYCLWKINHTLGGLKQQIFFCHDSRCQKLKLFSVSRSQFVSMVAPAPEAVGKICSLTLPPIVGTVISWLVNSSLHGLCSHDLIGFSCHQISLCLSKYTCDCI